MGKIRNEEQELFDLIFYFASLVLEFFELCTQGL